MALFYNEEEERQADLNVIHNEADESVDLMNYATLVPSVIGKVFYDITKLGTDAYDWMADNKEATLDDYWAFESDLTGIERGNGEKIAGEILSLMAGTVLTGGAVTALSGASKISSTNRLVKGAKFLDGMRKGTQGTSKGAKLASKIGYYSMEGAVADGIFTSTGQDRLSNMLSEIEGFDNMAIEYLKHDDDDDAVTQRFKNFLEGSIVGAGAEMAVALTTGLFKVLRNNKDLMPVEEFNNFLKERGLQNWREEVITEGKVYQVTPDTTEVATTYLNKLSDNVDDALGDVVDTNRQNAITGRKNDKILKGSIEKLEELKVKLTSEGMTKNSSKVIQKEFLENLVFDDAVAKKISQEPENIAQILEGLAGAVPKTLDNLVNSKVFPEGMQTSVEEITQAITDAYGLSKKGEKYKTFLSKTLKDISEKGGLDASRAFDVQELKKLKSARGHQQTVLLRTEQSAKNLSSFVDRAGKTNPKDWTEKETLEFVDLYSTMMRDMLVDKRISGEFARGLADRGHNARDLMKLAKGEGFTRAEIFQYEEMLDDVILDLSGAEAPKAFKNSKLVKLRDSLMQVKNNPEKTAKVLEKIKRANGDPRKILKILTDGAEKDTSGAFDLFMELRRGNMLTSAGTHVTNAISGYGMMAYRIMQEYTSALMQAPERILRHDDTGKTAMEGFKRANAMVQGMVQVHKDFATDLFKNGYTDAMDKLGKLAFNDVAHSEKAGVRLIEKDNLQRILKNSEGDKPLINGLTSVMDVYGKVQHGLSFGILGGLDTVVKASLSKGTLMAEAQTLGAKHGWSIDAVEEFSEALMKRVEDSSYKHPSDILNREVDRITSKMEEAGLEATFQQDLGEGFLGRAQQLLNADNGVSKFSRAMVFPFFKTPANIALETMRTVPVLRNFSKTVNEALTSSDVVVKKRMEAKILMANVTYTMMAGMILDGSVTGTHKPEDRKMLNDMGIPENSIKVGDTWYSYKRLDPVGMMLGITADVINNTHDEGLIGATIMAGTQMTSKTYMQSVQQLMRAMDDPSDKLPKWLVNQGKSIVTPLVGVQRTVNKLTNDFETLKSYDNYIQTLGSDFIDFNTKTHKVDVFGQEIEKTTGFNRWLSGFGIDNRQATASSGRIEALRLGAIRDEGRKGSLGNVEMTDDEFNAYKKARNDLNLQGILDEITSDPEYRKLPDEARRTILKNVVRDIKKGAKEKFLFDVPEFSQKIAQRERQALNEFMQAPTKVGTELGEVRDLIRGSANRMNRVQELESLLDD